MTGTEYERLLYETSKDAFLHTFCVHYIPKLVIIWFDFVSVETNHPSFDILFPRADRYRKWDS